jgi:hypothetical protein
MDNAMKWDWWQGCPWWVQYAKQDGTHTCICPVCDRQHEPAEGGMYRTMTQPFDDEAQGDGERDFESGGPVGHA